MGGNNLIPGEISRDWNEKQLSFFNTFQVDNTKKAIYLDTIGKYRTVKNPIKEREIINHFNGNSVIAWFGGYNTEWLIIDLDNHETKKNKPYTIAENDLFLFTDYKDDLLIEKYKTVISVLGRPSVLMKSSESRGLHLYFRLKRQYHYRELFFQVINLFNKKLDDRIKAERDLSKHGIELYPRPRKAISAFNKKKKGGCLIDDNFKPILTDADYQTALIYVNNAIPGNLEDDFIRLIYPEQILKNTINHEAPEMPESKEKVIQTPRENRKQSFSFFELATRHTLSQGQTNEYILTISRIGRGYRIPEQTVIDYIDKAFFEAEKRGLIRKQDRRKEGIKKSVESLYQSYKDLPEYEQKIENKAINKSLDLFQTHIVYQVADKVINYLEIVRPEQKKKNGELKIKVDKGMKRAIRRFCHFLFSTNEYYRKMSNEDALFIHSYRSEQYFYYWVKSRGATPLPRVKLKRWSRDYVEIMDALEFLGVVKLLCNYSSSYYEEKKGVCRYYEIDFNNITQTREISHLEAITDHLQRKGDRDLKNRKRAFTNALHRKLKANSTDLKDLSNIKNKDLFIEKI